MYHAASSAILERNGRYLLIRRLNPPMSGVFAFPGGRAEPGETPQQTAIREFEEETGIKIFNPVLYATYEFEGGESRSAYVLSVFKVEADPESQAVAADDAADAGWYTINEMRNLPMPASMRDCTERLAVELAPGYAARTP